MFILAICVLLIISTFAYRSTIALENSQEQITRSYQVKSELYYLYFKLAEAKASQREYLITEKNESLKPYEEARGKIDKTIRRLELYAQSSPEQAERLKDLKWSVAAAVYSLEDVLSVENSDGKNKTQLLQRMDDNNVLLRSVKEQVKEMARIEDILIRENRLNHIKQSSFTPYGSLLLILFALLALVLFYYQINEDFEQLRTMNRELETTNTELNSFNHITSHDLQEPLRKIETFISRLEDKERQNLSDTGKQYLDKISSSASNMRRLIQDLLLFSQTNSTDRGFEKASLQQIIEDVTNDLVDELETRNGKIMVAHDLPEIECIPFLMHQLFANLIGNSIKYSKADIPPLIEVSYSFYEPDDSDKKIFTDSRYHKITLKDNGIGFEQQYASKIFDLFERLHQKNEYSGSGIGLAICKKIVDKHGGVISAEGVPGKGASFYIFLPA